MQNLSLSLKMWLTYWKAPPRHKDSMMKARLNPQILSDPLWPHGHLHFVSHPASAKFGHQASADHRANLDFSIAPPCMQNQCLNCMSFRKNRRLSNANTENINGKDSFLLPGRAKAQIDKWRTKQIWFITTRIRYTSRRYIGLLNCLHKPQA